MRWSRMLQTIDVHCEGEIGRVVTGGLLDLPGATMAAKLDYINSVDDRLRRLLTSEPRGGPAGSVVLLPPATLAEADSGFIVLQPDQAHAMSGSNAICTTTALIESGMVPAKEPTTVVRLDTAAGLVEATAHCRDGACERVTLDMPTAFVEELDATIETEDWGRIHFDICYGGVFYALVDVEQLGLKIEPAQARALASAGAALAERMRPAFPVSHPETPEISGLAYVMFRATESDGVVRTCTILHPARADRSPCGTGSTANIAALQARGAMAPGNVLTTRSIIGSEFEVRLVEATELAGRPAAKVQISGRGWIYGLSQIGLDPADPFPEGFRVSDTWGPLDG